MQKLDLEKTNQLLKEVPQLNRIINKDISNFVKAINEGNYRSIQKRFDKKTIDLLMEHHIQKEDWDECIKIRDRWKRKKATGN